MGTSAPEAAVSITASLGGDNAIAIANIIGSNIFNLLIVVGVCAIMCNVKTDLDILKRDLPVNIGISALLLFFLMDLKISRMEGIILMLVFALYLWIVVRNGLKNRNLHPEEGEGSSQEKVSSPAKSILFIIIGLAAIIYGGNLVVGSASTIAETLGLSQNLIGLTIVAVGTSLPELVTSIVAARKGEGGLALGNAVGSCIFNILFILGISATLSPLAAIRESFIDECVLIAVSILMFMFGKTGNKTTRKEGIFCVACYIAYMVYAVLR